MPELLQPEHTRLSRIAALLTCARAATENAYGQNVRPTMRYTAKELCLWSGQDAAVKQYSGMSGALKKFLTGLISPDDNEEYVPDFEIFNWLAHPPKLNWQIAWDWAPR